MTIISTFPEQEQQHWCEPCPFCGSHLITIGYNGQPAQEIFAQCCRCRASGPVQSFTVGMVFDFKVWNKRALPVTVELGEVRRGIALEGENSYLAILNITKFATPRTEKEFIHLDKLADGTWRLLFNVQSVDIKDVQAFRMLREN